MINNMSSIIQHLSYSSISKAYQCPKSWWEAYVNGHRGPSGAAADWGTAWGEMVESALIGKELKNDKLEGISEDIIESARIAKDEYFAQSRAWQEADAVQVEVNIDPDKWKFWAEKYDAPSEIHFPVIGYIDARKGKTVMDLKSTSAHGFKPDWAYQTTLYALHEECNKWEIHKVKRKQLKKGEVREYEFYDWHPNPDVFREVMTWIANGSKKIHDMLEHGVKPEAFPSPMYCGFCPVGFDCAMIHFNRLEAYKD